MIPPAVCTVYMLRFCVSSQEVRQTKGLVCEVSSSLSITWDHVELPKENRQETIKR